MQLSFEKTPIFILDLKSAEEHQQIVNNTPHLKLITTVSLLQKRPSSELATATNMHYLRVPLRRSQLLLMLYNVFSSTKKRKSGEYHTGAR